MASAERAGVDTLIGHPSASRDYNYKESSWHHGVSGHHREHKPSRLVNGSEVEHAVGAILGLCRRSHVGIQVSVFNN